jgi:hypothetical protein
MIKYFSSILSKFTPRQRVFVIILLTLALITVTLGPFIIRGYRPDNTELRKRIAQKEIDNSKLTNEVSTLNGMVIKNQQKCTNMMVDREKEILTQLEELEKRYHLEQSSNRDKISSMMVDTVDLGVSPAQSEIPVMVITDNKQSNSILRDIRKMKEGIQKRIPVKTE